MRPAVSPYRTRPVVPRRQFWRIAWCLFAVFLVLQGLSFGFNWTVENDGQPIPEKADKHANTSRGGEEEDELQLEQFDEEEHQSEEGRQPRPSTVQAWKQELWAKPPDGGYKPCIEQEPDYRSLQESSGYLMVHCNGGLNQMRTGICDMVAVARLLNATLVLPELDKGSFWADNSTFADLFDVEGFISGLQNDVRVVKKLPKGMREKGFARKAFKSWGSAEYYQEEISALWKQYKVIRATKSDSRLANNNLPPGIQKLRCRVAYQVLQFAAPIQAVGRVLLERARAQAGGPFIALHLRFEKDMLAFTGCTHGLAPEEVAELKAIRMKTRHWRVKDIDATRVRHLGRCPLLPSEVGLMLSAMGYPNTTLLYIAGGAVYGGEARLAALKAYFPNLTSKEKLLSAAELAPFQGHASQLAALDYSVAVESDVFVASFSGNMARAVEGHRRFAGHRRSISPDRKSLVALFERFEQGELSFKELGKRVAFAHQTRQGSARPRYQGVEGKRGKALSRTEESFYTNPLPDCLCRDPTRVATSLHA